MTTAPTDQNPMSSSDREGDDLTAIKGIGPARQRWFRESLNICTFRDLAALSADEIESRLKAEGQIACRGEIDGWIAQAQELAAVNLSSQRAVEAAEGEWQPFASFVVEFQARRIKSLAEERRTMVHHMEADKGETWSGIEGERLCQWMLDQVGARVQQVIEEKLPVEVRPAVARPVTVEIAQVRAFQPPQTETPIGVGEAGRPFRGFVRGDEPFALEASFGLAGPAAAEIAKKQIIYHAQFHARSLPTGERIHLGDMKPNTLVEGKLSYTAVLPEATLRPGLYRLRVMATLQGMPPILGYLEVPLLQVV